MYFQCEHSFVDDYQNGFSVCTNCGLVSSELIIDIPEYRSFENSRYHYEKTLKNINNDDVFDFKDHQH